MFWCPASPTLAARQAIDEFVDILSFEAEILDPTDAAEDVLRDPMDLPVLGTLIRALEQGGVDYLITGDKDLLAASRDYPIVTPAVFCSRHGGL